MEIVTYLGSEQGSFVKGILGTAIVYAALETFGSQNLDVASRIGAIVTSEALIANTIRGYPRFHNEIRQQTDPEIEG